MAGTALDELFRSLLSKTGPEKMTTQESNVFVEWKSQAIKSCAVGGSLASTLAWMATRNWRTFNRVMPVAGAGFMAVSWAFGKSVNTCVDRILKMEGSRMQYEMEKIILEKYGNDPEKMKPFSKHFYCEEIYNDSTPGRPKPIYRQRHLHVDSHRTTDENANHESAKKGVYHQQRKDDSNVNIKNPGAEDKQSPIHPGINIFGYGDPLDVLFGYSSSNEEPHHLPDASGNSNKVQSRSQRRARRRHRMRHRHQETLPLGGI